MSRRHEFMSLLKTVPSHEPYSILSWEEEVRKVQLPHLWLFLSLLRIGANVPFNVSEPQLVR